MTDTFDINEVEIEETTEEIVKPIPAESLDPEPPSDKPLSAAERVRARLTGGSRRDGARPSGPSTTRSARRPSDTPPKPREGTLVKPLTDLYTGLGLMLAPVDPVCSAAFINNAEACAKSLETLARENEAVRRAILALTQTSAWGGVIIAHLPILLMVMTHHGPDAMKERISGAALLMNPAAMEHFVKDAENKDEE